MADTKSTQHYTREELEELKQAFNFFDHDHDSAISGKELQTVLKKVLGQTYTDAQIKKIISKFDANGDGEIDFGEFVTMMKSHEHSAAAASRDKNSMAELKEAFAVFDKNGDGDISWKELQTVMSALGENVDEDTLKLMIQSVDTDGDYTISFDEFVAMMKEGPPKSKK
eukprot:gb/GEZN01018159.1/.p1 GENE.gb/GEZN01018159.1/~~gb/GEZN01018159.1/.p1  ORF type:complete len:169 (+),score=39.04 gb/GEZN01018159.1/:29-535(+)